MENYTITKEKVLQLHKNNSEGNDQLVSADLKKWFPEAFKKELEIGKWYKYKLALFYITNKISNNTNYYNVFGFDVDGNWMADNATTYFYENYIEATPEEVEASLISEAKKRGYKGGIKLSHLESCSNVIDTEKEDVYSYIPKVSRYIGNRLQLNGTGIYQDGKWAEIFPQEKTVVPMAKALKIIAKKLKVSPENIEIQS